MQHRQQPRTEPARFLHLPDRPPGDEERFLDEVFGAVDVAGLEVGAGIEQPRRPPDQLLERRAIPVATLDDQRVVRLRQTLAPVGIENVSWTYGARRSCETG